MLGVFWILSINLFRYGKAVHATKWRIYKDGRMTIEITSRSTILSVHVVVTENIPQAIPNANHVQCSSKNYTHVTYSKPLFNSPAKL